MYQRGYSYSDDNYANLHIGKNYKSFVFATSLLYYSSGEIELFKSNGTKVTEVGKRDIIWTAGASRKFWMVPLGINLKLISSELFGKKATAYAFDLGTQYKLSKPINLGLSARNIGTKIKYIAEKENLPFITQLGGNYTRTFDKYSLLVLDDIAYYKNEKEYFNIIGAELGYKEQLYLRAGYRINLSETKNQSFNLGLGIIYKKYTIDYSSEFNQGLNIPHKVTLGYKF